MSDIYEVSNTRQLEDKFLNEKVELSELAFMLALIWEDVLRILGVKGGMSKEEIAYLIRESIHQLTQDRIASLLGTAISEGLKTEFRQEIAHIYSKYKNNVFQLDPVNCMIKFMQIVGMINFKGGDYYHNEVLSISVPVKDEIIFIHGDGEIIIDRRMAEAA